MEHPALASVPIASQLHDGGWGEPHVVSGVKLGDTHTPRIVSCGGRLRSVDISIRDSRGGLIVAD